MDPKKPRDGVPFKRQQRGNTTSGLGHGGSSIYLIFVDHYEDNTIYRFNERGTPVVHPSRTGQGS